METDLVSSSKGKLGYFRMKELKDVLTKLGLPKQGKKQDLLDRILYLLSDVGVAKIIDDTYRKMQIVEASELATIGQSGLDLYNMKLEMEAEDSLNTDVKICCPCGILSPTESMVQCFDPRCQVQQHISCVIIPEKHMEEIPSLPPLFFCEMCRLERADPFWVTMAHLVSPMKLVVTTIPSDGTNPLQNAETTFQLTKAHGDLLQNDEYDVQAWCILLNDKVPFRMQWPLHADLQINGRSVRTFNRPGTQLLGANGRDNGPLITENIGKGVNKICFSACDARSFCFGVRLVKKRTVEQVLNLITKETAGELFEDALARVCRCIGGGMTTGNEDSDSDLEVIADSITVKLCCPMSGSRIKVAGRFKPCVHMGCFDLETFVQLNQRARKWQCPICLKNYSLEDVIIDPYFYHITTMMRNCGEDVTEIEVKPDGSWRVKTKGENNDLAQWHIPEAPVFNSEIEEGCSGHTTLIARIKKNLSANVEVSKRQVLSPRNQMVEENYSEKVRTRSSCASGSGINQDTNTGIGISCASGSGINHRTDGTYGIGSQISMPTTDTNIIVLSDSEDDNVTLVPPATAYQSFFPIDNAPAGISNTYLQDPALDDGANSCFGLFSGNVDDSGICNWSHISGTHVAGFQMFDTVPNVPDAFFDLEHPSMTCSAPENGYMPASKSTGMSGREVLDAHVCHSNIDIDEPLIDNALPFIGEDPSLGHLVPSQPNVLYSETEPGQPPSNGVLCDNWISLRVGSNTVNADVGSRSQFATTNGLELRSSSRPNGASLSGEPKSNRTNDRKISDGPFSFPRQPRSVRHRIHLS